MASYCFKNGIELWYKPRSKFVLVGKDLTWDTAVSVQETFREMGIPCYIVIVGRV